MVEDEGNAPTQVTKDTTFTVSPAYFNGLILQYFFISSRKGFSLRMTVWT